jgi:hypothetical protein
MILSPTQRALLSLGMVFAIALFPLVGGLHHHDHDDGASERCWFCTTATAAVLSAGAPILAMVAAWASIPTNVVTAPSRFPWMARHRRGPPYVSLA